MYRAGENIMCQVYRAVQSFNFFVFLFFCFYLTVTLFTCDGMLDACNTLYIVCMFTCNLQF